MNKPMKGRLIIAGDVTIENDSLRGVFVEMTEETMREGSAFIYKEVIVIGATQYEQSTKQDAADLLKALEERDEARAEVERLAKLLKTVNVKIMSVL